RGCKLVGRGRRWGAAEFKTDTSVAAPTTEPQVKEAVATAITRLGGLDVLINNAGVLDLQDPGDDPTSSAREHMEVNFVAPWRVTAAALPALVESHGRGVNVASLFSVLSALFHPAYFSSKRAVRASSAPL